MTKKHAAKYAKLMKEYEEVKDSDLESENETKKGDEGKEQVLKNKVEEILTLVKEMSKGAKINEDDKGEQVDIDRILQENAGLKEPEKILKA